MTGCPVGRRGRWGGGGPRPGAEGADPAVSPPDQGVSGPAGRRSRRCSCIGQGLIQGHTKVEVSMSANWTGIDLIQGLTKVHNKS